MPTKIQPATEELNVYRIRTRAGKIGATQEHFAETIGVSPRTYRNWEQHRRKPTGAARVLLRMIERDPAQAVSLIRG